MELGKRDLLHVLNAINSCLLINDNTTVRSCLDTMHDVIPFKAAVLCATSAQHSGALRFTNVINHSYPDAWVKTYEDNDFGRVDPVVNYALRSDAPFTWGTAYAAALTNHATRSFVQAARDHDLNHGITYLYQNGRGQGTLLSLTLQDSPLCKTRHYDTVLRYVVPHLHASIDRASCTIRNHASPALTTREREVLTWVKEGKSSWEIGCILRISERTVKFHISNMLGKLNAVSRSHALAKAVEYGLI